MAMKNSNKRQLITSIMSLGLSVTMLMGTTLAWFTDNASTTVSTITSGRLDVVLLDGAGNDVANRSLGWQTADNRDQASILWEPGATYNLEPVTVKNNGNLALKYKVTITGINGDAELNDVIDWNINGADIDNEYSLEPGMVKTINISGTMDKLASNDYMGKSIDGITISVIATQDTIETDSTGNQYDANAQYPWDGEDIKEVIPVENNTYIVSTPAELAWIAQEVNTNGKSFSGKTIRLDTDIDLGNKTWNPIGQTGAGQFQGTFDGNGYAISNFVVDTTSQNGTYHASGLFGWVNGATIKNLTIKNANVKGNQYVGAIAGYIESNSPAIVENCHVINSKLYATDAKVGAVVGFGNNGGTIIKDCTAKNSTIEAGRDAGQIVGMSQPDYVKNCKAEDVTVKHNGKGIGTNIRNKIIGRVI